MSPNLYLVFSERPGRISDEQYHAWYTDHAQENIESPGFLSAQRYRVREVVSGEATGPEQHLTVYDYEGDDDVADRPQCPHPARRRRPSRVVQGHQVHELDVRADRRPAASEDPLIRVRTAFRQRMASTPRMFLPACMSA